VTELTDPISGDPLALSNGLTQVQYVAAGNAAINIRTSANVLTTDHYADLATTVLNAADATTNWVATGTYTSDPNPGPYRDTAIKSEGTASVSAFLKGSASDNSSVYVNLPSAVPVGSHTDVLLDVYASEENGNTWTRRFWSLMIGSADALAGTTVTVAISTENIPTLGAWYTLAIPVGAVSSVKSIGIKKTLGGGATQNRARFRIDNIRLSDNTPLDRALASASTVGVVVPPNYTTAMTQRIRTPATKGVLDLRPSHASHTGLNGRKNVRDWQIDETGATDVAADLNAIFSSLSNGDTLEFPSSGIYRLGSNVILRSKNDITIDAKGATFVLTSQRNDCIFTVESSRHIRMRNFRVYGFSPAVSTGSQLTTVTGTPTVVSTTVQLNAQNEEVRSPAKSGTSVSPMYARDRNGDVTVAISASDSAQVAGDLQLRVMSEDGLTTYYSTTQTLTGSQATYSFTFPHPVDLEARLKVLWRKATATANTITLYSQTEYGRGRYEANYALNSAFTTTLGSTDVVFEDMHVEGVGGDAVAVVDGAAERITARRIYSRVVMRQGLSMNTGKDLCMEDFVSIGASRSGIDIEPNGDTDSVQRIRVARGYISYWGPDQFAFTMIGWAKIFDLDIDGVVAKNDISEGFMRGGANRGRVRNITYIDTSAAVATDYKVRAIGIDMEFQNVTLDSGGFQFGYETDVYDDGGGDVTFTPGGNRASNIRILKPTASHAVSILSEDSVIDGVSLVRDDTALPVGTSWVGPVEIGSTLTNSFVTNFDPGFLRSALGNTYKGVAITKAWFPRGLDMRSDGIFNTRGLSGSTTRANNLRAINATVASGAGTHTVTFPAKTYQNPATFALTNRTGSGTLTAAKYYYRVAGRNIEGGPLVPLAEKNVTLAGANNEVLLQLTGLYSLASDFQIAGFTVYRGISVGGPYTSRYDVVPSADFYALGHTVNVDTVYLVDLGTTLADSGSNNRAHGYAFPYAASTGTFTPVDETGYEPNATYAVFVETTWATTVRVTAKRTNGFDLQFGTAAGATDTLSWMIVR
jgi:hypothetical protein